MKPTEHAAPPAYTGHVKNGVIVLDAQITLDEGQAVRVEPVAPIDAARADRLRQLQQLFTQWTEEDGLLTDEEAGRLHAALDQSRGLEFRSPALD